jgi:hypothetical protein
MIHIIKTDGNQLAGNDRSQDLNLIQAIGSLGYGIFSENIP